MREPTTAALWKRCGKSPRKKTSNAKRDENRRTLLVPTLTLAANVCVCRPTRPKNEAARKPLRFPAASVTRARYTGAVAASGCGNMRFNVFSISFSPASPAARERNLPSASNRK